MANKKISIEEVKRRLFEVHGTEVSIDEGTYQGMRNKATFIHEEEGRWEAIASSVICRGSSHPQLELKNRRLPLDKVKERLRRIHANTVSIIDDSYISTMKRATFNHEIYGEWEAIVSDVIRGQNHPVASLEQKKIPISEIKKRIFDVHGNDVRIDEKTYIGINSRATFIHSKYGSWQTFVSCVLKGSTHKEEFFSTRRLSVEDVETRIMEIHGTSIKMDSSSYIDSQIQAKFSHEIYGEFMARPHNILYGQGPMIGRHQKSMDTNMERYGVPSPSQNRGVALKMARNTNGSTVAKHWRTGEELICIGGYETKTINYLNVNKVDYLWQSRVFETSLLTPKGSRATYRPDLFLVNENKWIEIKGYFRGDAKTKWDWFQSQYPNSELWDKKKLKEMGIL